MSCAKFSLFLLTTTVTLESQQGANPSLSMSTLLPLVSRPEEPSQCWGRVGVRVTPVPALGQMWPQWHWAEVARIPSHQLHQPTLIFAAPEMTVMATRQFTKTRYPPSARGRRLFLFSQALHSALTHMGLEIREGSSSSQLKLLGSGEGAARKACIPLKQDNKPLKSFSFAQPPDSCAIHGP